MTRPVLWQGAEVVRATGGRLTRDFAAAGVSIDSRSLQPGDLFVALKGENRDGQQFVRAAFDAGAAAAVVRVRPLDVDANRPLVLVGDPLRALEDLGRAGRARARARVVGVTGSVGKTGTKEMLARALGALGTCHVSVGSFNNQFGVPLSLARLDPETAFAVFEMGMNHPGEIAALTRMVRPEIALITTVEAVHLGQFEGTDQIAEAKAEIFLGVEPGGVAVLNRDNPFFRQLALRARQSGVKKILTFGTLADADIRLLAYQPEPGANRVCAEGPGGQVDYRLAIDGRHWALNSLGVLGVVVALGGDPARAAAALADMPAPKGRGARLRIAFGQGSIELIDDSYNASPASMRAAFAVLAETRLPSPAGRRIAVLGDMLELGPSESALHAGLAGDLSRAGIDLVFTVGSRMQALAAALPAAMRSGHFADAQTAVAPLIGALAAGDVVLVKGSAGSRMGRVVEGLRALDADLPKAANGER